MSTSDISMHDISTRNLSMHDISICNLGTCDISRGMSKVRAQAIAS